MTPRTLYRLTTGAGVALIAIGMLIAASVFTLIEQTGRNPYITADGHASLVFMTRTTGAVLGMFLGTVVIAGCVVVAITRRWIDRALVRAEARLKVGTRQIAAGQTAADSLAAERHDALVQAHSARQGENAATVAEMRVLVCELKELRQDLTYLLAPMITAQLEREEIERLRTRADVDMDRTVAGIRAELDEHNGVPVQRLPELIQRAAKKEVDDLLTDLAASERPGVVDLAPLRHLKSIEDKLRRARQDDH